MSDVIRWSPSQALAVRDHLLACSRGQVFEYAFDDEDCVALNRLIEKAEAAIQLAFEDAGVRKQQ